MDTLLSAFDNLGINNNDTLDHFKSIICQNSYINSCSSNKEKSINSFSYLIKLNLSQSECIKAGHCFEKLIHEMGMIMTDLEDIRPANKKNMKEKDFLFKNEETKTIYYTEVKTNLELDTEKAPKTVEKCKLITEQLLIQYPEYEIITNILGGRYFQTLEIPSNIRKRFSMSVLGLNEYFELLGVDHQFKSEKQYSEMLTFMAKRMIDHS